MKTTTVLAKTSSKFAKTLVGKGVETAIWSNSLIHVFAWNRQSSIISADSMKKSQSNQSQLPLMQ